MESEAFVDWLQGMPYKEIAAKYGVAFETVRTWYARYNWKGRREDLRNGTLQKQAPLIEIIPNQDEARKAIERDLRTQLETKGATQSFFLSLVDDYLAFWDTKNMLIADIKNRGAIVQATSGFKKNDSVSELTKINAQMLKILSELSLKVSEQEAVDDDDEL